MRELAVSGGSTAAAAGEPGGVCVFAPALMLTVTIEADGDGDDIHFHAGGQGFWVARLLAKLGIDVVLCSVFGGEAGHVVNALADAERLTIRNVGRGATTGAYVHDRRDGARRVVAESPCARITRHEADELYGAALAASLDLGLCVLTGPGADQVIDASLYRRLAADLRSHGVEVICDLSGAELRAALAGGVTFAKVSDEDLRRDGELLVEGESVLRGLERVLSAGADAAAVTRAERPLVAAVDGQVRLVKGPRLEPADHRGAGDAFTSVVTAARFWGIGWADAIKWGAGAGALAAARHGLGSADRRDLHRVLSAVRTRRVPWRRAGTSSTGPVPLASSRATTTGYRDLVTTSGEIAPNGSRTTDFEDRHYPQGRTPSEEALVETLAETVRLLEEEGVRHLLMGGIGTFALARPRVTRDIDVFIQPDSLPHALDVLHEGGFETTVRDPSWLAKATKRGVVVDLIFRSAGCIYLDDEMVERAERRVYKGVTALVVSPEDLLVIKALAVSEETAHHWYDALALISRRSIDWSYVLRRAARTGPRRVLSLLLYAESCDLAVPASAVGSLFALVHGSDRQVDDDSAASAPDADRS